VTPVEPLIAVQEHTAQTKDSVADSVDRQSNNDPSIAEVDMPDTPQATHEVPGALPPSPVIVAPADGSVITSRSIIFVGMAEPNCTVRLNDWTVPVGEGHADAEGRWNITVSGVPDETHLYTAQAIRIDGDVSPASPACTVTVQAERRPTSSAADPEADGWTKVTVPASARRHTTAVYLALLLVLAAITTVEFWAQSSSHHRPALTATRRAVPAPATTWHFPAVSGPAQQVLMTLSNRNPRILTVQVNSHGTLVQRLQIPPKNGAEIELPPKVARMPLTIRATGPIVPERLVVNGSRVHSSYGSRSL
jgi:hypothetical protein